MLKSLLLSFVFGFSACTIASETKSATKPFTNEQLGNIEYTVKFSYIPKEDDSLYGFIKGKPVKIIEQHFILDFKDGSRKVTRLIGNDKDKNLGLTNIEKFVPDTNTNLKTVNITMRDEKKLIIENFGFSDPSVTLCWNSNGTEYGSQSVIWTLLRTQSDLTASLYFFVISIV